MAVALRNQVDCVVYASLSYGLERRKEKGAGEVLRMLLHGKVGWYPSDGFGAALDDDRVGGSKIGCS